jgi:aminotransferase
MKSLSTIAREVSGSPIRKMFNIANQMKDVISFTVGGPDFVTPRNISDAAVRSLARGETHYTPNAGILPLRKAIARRVGEELSTDPDPDRQIIVTAGGMEALMLAMMVILDPGDEVIMSDPHWSNYPRQVLMCGAVPRFVAAREKDGFVLAPEEVRAAITARTKMIILNSPANPTGAVMDVHTLSEIAAMAVEHDLYVISDEVYHHFLYEGAQWTSISTLEGMRERTLVVDSFSKTYAMTGWRVGYAIGPEEMISNMVKYQENVIGSVNTQAQYAAIEALEGSQAPLQEMLRTYTKRRSLIVEGINGIPRLSCAWPKGAFYCFVNISESGLDSESFATELLKKNSVVTVPGSGFGKAGEGYIRLSYATSEENIESGLSRIRSFMEART